MKSIKEWNDAILNITMKIQTEAPELSKFMMEMPVTIPDNDNPQINLKALKDYYDSLAILYKDYQDNKH